jgi:hypothetical protein
VPPIAAAEAKFYSIGFSDSGNRLATVPWKGSLASARRFAVERFAEETEKGATRVEITDREGRILFAHPRDAAARL